VYLMPPLKVSLWNWVSAQRSEETRMMALREIKSFKTGLAVLIQYRRVMDTHAPSQPASHVAVTSTRYAYLCRAVKTEITETSLSCSAVFVVQ